MDKKLFKTLEKSHLFIIDRFEDLASVLKAHYEFIHENYKDLDIDYYINYRNKINSIADDAFWHLMDFLHGYEKNLENTKDNKSDS